MVRAETLIAPPLTCDLGNVTSLWLSFLILKMEVIIVSTS